MTILLNEQDISNVIKLENNIISSIEHDTFQHDIIMECFDINDLLPEYILKLSNDMKNINLDEALDPNRNNRNKGVDYLTKALGVSKNVAIGMLQNPKNAAIAFRSLRNKLEDIESQESRARAEKKGFLAIVIYTIKQAMAWIAKTFADIKDYVLDSAIDSRQEGAAKAKRDFKWINRYGERYMDKTFQWYNDADKTNPRLNTSMNYPNHSWDNYLFNKGSRYLDER